MCDNVSDSYSKEKERDTMGGSAGGGVMQTSDKPTTPTILLRAVTSQIKLTNHQFLPIHRLHNTVPCSDQQDKCGPFQTIVSVLCVCVFYLVFCFYNPRFIYTILFSTVSSKIIYSQFLVSLFCLVKPQV